MRPPLYDNAAIEVIGLAGDAYAFYTGSRKVNLETDPVIPCDMFHLFALPCRMRIDFARMMHKNVPYHSLPKDLDSELHNGDTLTLSLVLIGGV